MVRITLLICQLSCKVAECLVITLYSLIITRIIVSSSSVFNYHLVIIINNSGIITVAIVVTIGFMEAHGCTLYLHAFKWPN